MSTTFSDFFPTRFQAGRLLLALALTVSSGCSAGAQEEAVEGGGADPGAIVAGALGARLDSLLSRYVAYGFSGTVLVEKDGRVILHRGYGWADRERRVRNATSTLFEWASLTKPFTAAAILRLEEQGKLRTGDPLSRHLGAFPAPKDAATIHHLLTHTAGLSGDAAQPNSPDRATFVANMKAEPADAPPGEKYRYSNFGFSVLAALVEQAAGEPFEAFVARVVLRPAGMDMFAFRAEAVPAGRSSAVGYFASAAGVAAAPALPYQWGNRGAGGLVTTTGAIHTFYRALTEGRLLSDASREKMFHPWPTEGYGWHVEVDSAGSVSRLHKGGGAPAFATQLWDERTEGVLIVFASNVSHQQADGQRWSTWRQPLLRGIHATLRGEAAVLPPPVADVPAGAIRSVAGRYRAPGGEEVRLDAADSGLHFAQDALEVPSAAVFHAQGGDAFAAFDLVGDRVLTLRVERAGDGRVAALLLARGDSPPVRLPRSGS